jgi:tetratricopeptide (TPR) repeat protein
MDVKTISTTIRRLQTAEGYLELNLPQRARAELNAIEDQGPFDAAIALLEGEALKSERRYDEAIVPLKRAASMIPFPLNKRAWRSLVECYRLSDRLELAELSDMVVNTEEQQPPEPKPTVRVAFIPLPMLPDALKEIFAELNERGDN